MTTDNTSPTATDLAIAVLESASASDKVTAANGLSKAWQSGIDIGDRPLMLSDVPARPDKPELVSPASVPRRRLGNPDGRAALLHAIAHIELNAIDLAADMMTRFSTDSHISASDRRDFVSDWVKVCREEAYHFSLLNARLNDLGYAYGDFVAHNGLWEAALKTRHDISARLAIAPLVLEARGLDVTPAMIIKLEKSGDSDSAKILKIIYNDEIGHVQIGLKWFKYVCDKMGKDDLEHFRTLLNLHYRGQLKPPFNYEARNFAGMPGKYYEV